ncbi:ThuA domain-containing protein [Chitinophaga sp. MM2321]|uniref:ThuA domain-containing protein n=1 Tax=Chitinophaga sp. MM2321 TaxID=3137178 RepID=UPI0032D575BA
MIACVMQTACKQDAPPARILVFTKTAGFRHIDAIDTGLVALRKMAQEKGFIMDTTEDAGNFNEEHLKRYRAVVFLQASGALFNEEQRTAFQRYIQAGGGFVAIHAPTDAERDWPWYGQLIGAYFLSHPADPNVQKGTYVVKDQHHPATDSLPDHFTMEDEFYDFTIVNPGIKTLIALDEQTYKGGKMGADHPAVWYHDFDGGRSFYMAMGHTTAAYSNPVFLKILWGGLYYAMGADKPVTLDYSKALPEENRFHKEILMEKLNEPIHLVIADDGKIFFAQRRGEIIEYDQQAKQSKIIGTLPVSGKYEDGLLGITLDPAFSTNKWIYVYYTQPGGTAFHVSRYTLNKEGMFDMGSEKILLKIPKQILDGSHTGGGLLFDVKGSGDLFITTGDNSSPRGWGYAPIDERKGKEDWDAQRSAGNTNDLRGKILRIHPEPDGTYSIPAGNLFPKGESGTLPEIYSMGHRQPWRITMDSKTGWLYVGEVGPDANDDSTGLGPKGYDEFNQIRKPGNYGWPYFVADNKAYWQYNFATGKSGDPFNPAGPVNNSPNNTGLKTLPPAQKAFIWYPYSASKEFPLMGSGARCATGGPVFHRSDFKNAPHVFPDYYEGKWFITDWIRGWINVVTMDAEGNYKSMERFLPGHTFSNPIDMKFGPDGSLYMLEYGKGWFRANDDARLVKIVYNGGNRTPVVKVTADATSNAVPFKVNLSSHGTKDFDHDALTYAWKVRADNSGKTQTATTEAAAFTLDEPGIYTATLTVTDAKGAQDSAQVRLTAGNEPPQIALNITKGNSSFYFPGGTFNYEVTISDKEDSVYGGVSSQRAQVGIHYLAEGYTPLLGDPDPSRMHELEDKMDIYGGMVLNASDCYSCHAIDQKSIGPSFNAIAEKYKKDTHATERLVQKVIHGGSGVWGDAAMSAHPDLPPVKANEMISYILGLAKRLPPSLPLKGSYTTSVVAGKTDGVFVLKAAYTDSGYHGLPPLSAEKTIVLKSPVLAAAEADEVRNIMRVKVPGVVSELAVLYGPEAYVGFNAIDLTGITGIDMEVSPAIGGTLELHLDTPDGMLVSTPLSLVPGKGSFTEGKPVRIPLKATTGRHHLYFVLKAPGVTKSSLTVIITRLTFLAGSDKRK